MEDRKIPVSHKGRYAVKVQIKYEAGTAGIIFFWKIYGNCVINAYALVNKQL